MRWLLRVLVLLLPLGVVAGWGAHRAYQEARNPFRGYPGEEIFVSISAGESSSAIAATLEARGVIANASLFLLALRLRGDAGRLQAGEYRFGEDLSILDVIDRLVEGDVYYRNVTIPEGLTLWETAALLSAQGLGETKALEGAFERGGPLVAGIDPHAENLEGYLYPETYRFPRNPTPPEVAQALVSRFVEVFDEARRTKAAGLGLGIREVVTLASVVEKETGLAAERPVIASVFWNRLLRQMPLQSDPTIIYDLKRNGQFDGNLRRAHLEQETPYNTYRRPGLPPGPIASPGRDAIDAVLNPAASDYLYFVSRNDGSHQFSVSLREHNAAVQKYQVEHFRKERSSKRQRRS